MIGKPTNLFGTVVLGCLVGVALGRSAHISAKGAELVSLPNQSENELDLAAAKYFFGSSVATADDIKFMLYTSGQKDGKRMVASDSASITGSGFDSNKETYVIVHGWQPGGKDDAAWQYTARDNFLNKGDYNVMVVDWDGANSANYYSTAENAQIVGKETATLFRAIQDSSVGLNSRTVNMIGHGIGAHVCGIAGIYYGNIGRITGLSPSGEYFQDQDINMRLDCDDAIFVDAYHTDVEGFGYDGDCGDVDVYFNGGKNQPGASEPSAFLPVSLQFGGAGAIGGSHYRAIDLYLESMGATHYAYPASSYAEFMAGDSFDTKYELGVNMDTAARGFMYALTLSDAPYLTDNYGSAKASTGSSRWQGTIILKIRGLPTGETLEYEMLSMGGLFSALPGDVNTVFVLPDGAQYDQLGVSLAYRSSFFNDKPFSLNRFTMSEIADDGTVAASYSQCDAFTIQNTCTGECSYPLTLTLSEEPCYDG